MNVHKRKTLTWVVGIGLILLSVLFPEFSFGEGFDDLMTPDINEGAISSGFDDFMTPGINEGAWSK